MTSAIAGQWLITILRWPVLGLLLMLFLAALYRYAPDRDKARWRWVTPGAAMAVVLWLVGSFGFSFYVNNFGSYNETYGALAGIIVLLLWLFLSAYVIVLGAEFDAETERQTAEDSTVGPHRPLGTRGARAADTVAGDAAALSRLRPRDGRARRPRAGRRRPPPPGLRPRRR